jgi:hypothetical protein
MGQEHVSTSCSEGQGIVQRFRSPRSSRYIERNKMKNLLLNALIIVYWMAMILHPGIRIITLHQNRGRGLALESNKEKPPSTTWTTHSSCHLHTSKTSWSHHSSWVEFIPSLWKYLWYKFSQWWLLMDSLNSNGASLHLWMSLSFGSYIWLTHL